MHSLITHLRFSLVNQRSPLLRLFRRRTPCRSKTLLHTPNAHSPSRNTSRLWSTTRLHWNRCEQHVRCASRSTFWRSDHRLCDSTKKHGEDAPETADLYFAYGKALLENAISQNSVLGKQNADEDEDDEGMCLSLRRVATPNLTTRACPSLRRGQQRRVLVVLR